MRYALAFAVLIALPSMALAECRLALLLAIDVSSSVDRTEDQLQRGGLAAALTAPEVVEAFFMVDQPVALAAFEWSGRYQQDILLDWVTIDSHATLLAAAARIGSTVRGHDDYPTAMGHALGFGARMMEQAPLCTQQTIDMAGDGRNNDGFGPSVAYNAFPFDRITVNGLVVNAADFEGELDLIPFYRGEVLHGPGAFLEIAQGFADYERAMRRKLERELQPQMIGGVEDVTEPKG